MQHLERIGKTIHLDSIHSNRRGRKKDGKLVGGIRSNKNATGSIAVSPLLLLLLPTRTFEKKDTNGIFLEI